KCGRRPWQPRQRRRSTTAGSPRLCADAGPDGRQMRPVTTAPVSRYWRLINELSQRRWQGKIRCPWEAPGDEGGRHPPWMAGNAREDFPMALGDGSAPTSRRMVLGGLLGGLAGVVLHALGRPEPARAADGGPVLIGQSNAGTVATIV